MSMSANLHRIVSVWVQDIGSSETAALRMSDKDGNEVILFIPTDKAEAMAAAFNAPIDAPEPDQPQ